MARGFRVQCVEIEGFKGFASPQVVDFKGRHVFLLGQNGNGKSSIVEAIRWGLFGSAFRPNEVVSNQHYSGDCRVTVTLERDRQLWTLQRTLNLGARGTSDPVLTDQHGKRRNIREIMPQLDSVDAGEGTHVIFAAQSAPLRRQPEDLNPFEKTVLNYLGLTHPRGLLSNIQEFLVDQSEAEQDLAEELTEARESLDGQIAEEQTRMSQIMNAPPWGNELSPSMAVSEQKVRRFIEDVTGESPSDELDGASLGALVDSAAQSLDERRTHDQGNLEQERDEIAAQRGALEALRELRAEMRMQESVVEKTQADLESIFDGLTPVELRCKLERAKDAASTESITGRIVRDALDLIRRGDAAETLCPVCSTHHDREALEFALQGTIQNSNEAVMSSVATLESRVAQSESLQARLQEQESRCNSLMDDVSAATSDLHAEDRVKLDKTRDIGAIIASYLERDSEIEGQIENQDSWFELKAAQLNRLEEESRFHQIQTHLNRLQRERRELTRVIGSYGELVALGESVRAIEEVVKSRLREKLAQSVPRVSELLSKAFGALTQHPWYDRLIIAESTLPRLQLRVSSSQDSNGREDPTGVLNGQAESALHLVPYFAFSQTEDTPTEVYLVMLDDPTRALDTAHIRILVDRLQELGRNVQLIVASQETERLGEMIPEAFDQDSYAIIEPANWSPSSGPSLAIRYG
ncbi:MAG: AAA family ATPase [Chloroflexi bacterium]|nr:AAA family ATPase [Chloroflexota bacterium]